MTRPSGNAHVMRRRRKRFQWLRDYWYLVVLVFFFSTNIALNIHNRWEVAHMSKNHAEAIQQLQEVAVAHYALFQKHVSECACSASATEY